MNQLINSVEPVQSLFEYAEPIFDKFYPVDLDRKLMAEYLELSVGEQTDKVKARRVIIDRQLTISAVAQYANEFGEES